MLRILQGIAFVQRDFAITLSYPMRLPGQIMSVLISTMLFFFIGKLVGTGGEELSPYGGNYFSFVLVGIAFTDYLFVSVNGLSDEIRKGQMLGTLEAMLVAPLSATQILVCSSLYGFTLTTLRVFLYLWLGWMFFEVNLSFEHMGAFLIVLILTITSFWGLGLISATFVMVYKQSSPLNWAMGAFSGLVGGMMFPVEMLPGWLKPLSVIFPLRYSLEAMRIILLQGKGIDAVFEQVLALCGFTIVFLGFGLIIFNLGLRTAREDGTLLHY